MAAAKKDEPAAGPTVTGALVAFRTADGGWSRLYRGDKVEGVVPADEIKRLTDLGMVGEDESAVPGVAAMPVN